MKLLVDTNVFLEVLLSDAKAAEAKALLENAGSHDLFVSDFAFALDRFAFVAAKPSPDICAIPGRHN